MNSKQSNISLDESNYHYTSPSPTFHTSSPAFPQYQTPRHGNSWARRSLFDHFMNLPNGELSIPHETLDGWSDSTCKEPNHAISWTMGLEGGFKTSPPLDAPTYINPLLLTSSPPPATPHLTPPFSLSYLNQAGTPVIPSSSQSPYVLDGVDNLLALPGHSYIFNARTSRSSTSPAFKSCSPLPPAISFPSAHNLLRPSTLETHLITPTPQSDPYPVPRASSSPTNQIARRGGISHEFWSHPMNDQFQPPSTLRTPLVPCTPSSHTPYSPPVHFVHKTSSKRPLLTNEAGPSQPRGLKRSASSIALARILEISPADDNEHQDSTFYLSDDDNGDTFPSHNKRARVAYSAPSSSSRAKGKAPATSRKTTQSPSDSIRFSALSVLHPGTQKSLHAWLYQAYHSAHFRHANPECVFCGVSKSTMDRHINSLDGHVNGCGKKIRAGETLKGIELFCMLHVMVAVKKYADSDGDVKTDRTPDESREIRRLNSLRFPIAGDSPTAMSDLDEIRGLSIDEFPALTPLLQQYCRRAKVKCECGAESSRDDVWLRHAKSKARAHRDETGHADCDDKCAFKGHRRVLY